MYLLLGGGECCGCNIRDNGDVDVGIATCGRQFTDYQQTADCIERVY